MTIPSSPQEAKQRGEGGKRGAENETRMTFHVDTVDNQTNDPTHKSLSLSRYILNGGEYVSQ